MFNQKSRYAQLELYDVTDRRGRTVQVVPVPPRPLQDNRGRHILKQGQRLDHLAAKYLDDAAGFWRIAEHNKAMLPESLSEAREVDIPVKNR